MRNFYRNIAMRGFAGSSNSGGESAGGNTGGGNAGGGNEGWFNDGNTHIWITLSEGRTSPMLGVCPNGTVTVDWGDGTTPDVLTGGNLNNAKWTPRHEYPLPGDYVIRLVVDGQMGFTGSSSNNQYACILRYTNAEDGRNISYLNAVKKVEIGDSATSIGSYAFYSCYSLASINIPDGVTSIGSYAFNGCYGTRFYDFSNHTAVPTLSNTNVFTGIPSDCEIRVPAALYDEWIAATNWTTYASYIKAV